MNIILSEHNIDIYKSYIDYIRGYNNLYSSDTNKIGVSRESQHPKPEIQPSIVYAPLDENMSFRGRLNAAQLKSLKLGLASLGIGWLLTPSWMLQFNAIILFCVFFSMIAWRCTLLFCGWIVSAALPAVPTPQESESNLPIYTILIPAYRERALMIQIAQAMQGLDWPAAKLDILVLLEADDFETISAAEAAPFPRGTRIYRVPPGGPRTKPNALNHGLALARGAFVTIYDVEDLPAPNQLRDAYEAFKLADPRVICLQAPLIADNATHSWLTAQWGLEYDIQFRLLLPGLAQYKMPLLLGGTSNHFRGLM